MKDNRSAVLYVVSACDALQLRDADFVAADVEDHDLSVLGAVLNPDSPRSAWPTEIT